MPDIGLILAEDEAVKAKFSTLTVPDPKAQGGERRARAWFGYPSGERERTYPFITVDLIDIRFAAERAESMESVLYDWWPSEAGTMEEYATKIGLTLDPTEKVGLAIRFQPYDLYYQVATHARFSAHDRALTAKMLSIDYAPLSQLGTLHVPADNTQRWLDNEGWARADYIDPEGKNVHRKVYTLKVSAHMSLGDPVAYAKVLQVAADILGTADGEQYGSFINDGA